VAPPLAAQLLVKGVAGGVWAEAALSPADPVTPGGNPGQHRTASARVHGPAPGAARGQGQGPIAGNQS